MDERIRTKIAELVKDGVKKVEEMQRHIQAYVEKELFRGEKIPETSYKRFRPTHIEIYNAMYNIMRSKRYG